MKQWKGLLKKEWVLMRSWFFGTAIIAIFLMSTAPLGLSTLAEGRFNTTLIFGTTFIIWAVICMFLPVALLLTSLWKDWKQPDLWLHSTGSIFKLFGSKSVFAAIVGAVNVFVPTLLFVIYASIFGSPLYELSFNALVTFTGLLAFAFFTFSIIIMCVGLFLIVFAQFIKPFVKGFTVPITVLFFLVFAWVFERLKELTLYKNIAAFGPIGDPSREAFYIKRENFFIGPTEPIVYTGDVLMGLLFIGFLFIVASTLFEKKVRL